MDFHKLTRRELQTLCKKNKIPANMTNLSMADALQALETVEGMEEFLHTSESETAHSSIESPGKSEVTSPRMPPTDGWTTRRRNVLKEDPESLQLITRSKRTTRRTSTKDESTVDAGETPSEVAKFRKAPLASACRKMDSHFQECVEEEKKDVLDTPAASGITSRRRRRVKEEGTVKTVYNTRRSARLAERKVEVLGKVDNTESQPFKKDFFTKKCARLDENLKLNFTDFDEISGIAGVDGNTTMEDKSKEKCKPGVTSAGRKELTIDNEHELVKVVEKEPGHHQNDSTILEHSNLGVGNELMECGKTEDYWSENMVNGLCLEFTSVDENTTLEKSEEKDESEVVSVRRRDLTSSSECELVKSVEKEPGHHQKENIILEHDNLGHELEECGEIEDHCSQTVFLLQGKTNEVQEINGCHYVCPSEVEKVAVNMEALDINLEAGFADKADYFASEGSHKTCASETETALSKNDEPDIDKEADCLLGNEDSVEIICVSELCSDTDKEMNMDNDSDFFVTEEVLTIIDDAVDTYEKEKSTDGQCGSVTLDNISTDCGVSLDPTSMNEKEVKMQAVVSDWSELSAPHIVKRDINSESEMNLMSEKDAELEAIVSPVIELVQHGISAETAAIAQPPHLTPAEIANESSAMKKRLPAITDNKENIGSGGKFVTMKESVKIAMNTAESAPNLDGLSLRQLCKMLKQKLQITNKLNKNEHGDEAQARPALQALPVNRRMDENRN